MTHNDQRGLNSPPPHDGLASRVIKNTLLTGLHLLIIALMAVYFLHAQDLGWKILSAFLVGWWCHQIRPYFIAMVDAQSLLLKRLFSNRK